MVPRQLARTSAYDCRRMTQLLCLSCCRTSPSLVMHLWRSVDPFPKSLFWLCTLATAACMDKASQVLARGVPPGLPQSYRALADHGGVPRSTVHARAHDRQSMQKKAERQQYLTPSEDKALVDYFLYMANIGYPVRIKHVPDIAFRTTTICLVLFEATDSDVDAANYYTVFVDR